MSELLPCPKCLGNYQRVVETTGYVAHETKPIPQFYIECSHRAEKGCGIHTRFWNSLEESVNDWNTRAPVPSWISVEDRLPENQEYVLVFVKFHHPIVGFLHEKGQGWIVIDEHEDYIQDENITHWMPIPPAPVEKE